jgi:hypothetical protein
MLRLNIPLPSSGLESKGRKGQADFPIQCGILNISQTYRTPRSVTGIALLYGDGVCFL